MKAKLLLVVSERMDSNKKKDRYEDKLIRMGQKARENLGLTDDKTVELWPDGSTKEKLARSKVLAIFKAYTSDIKKLRDEGMSPEDILRVGFVTSRTFDYICGRADGRDIWLSDTIEDTIVGGDPEFLLMTESGRAKYAGSVSGFHHDGQLASDGPLAELRPNPEVNVNDFVKNIKDLLTNHENVNCISRYKWAGGCFFDVEAVDDPYGNRRTWPIGGHIHIGTPLRIAEKMARDAAFKNGTHATIQKILDEYVTIPMMKVDGVETSCIRRRHYGKYGEKRVKGQNGERLEFRSLSGQWLTHPKLAAAVLGTVKAVSHSVFKDIEDSGMDSSLVVSDYPGNIFSDDFNGWQRMGIVASYGAVKPNREMRSILHQGEVNFSKRQVNKLKKKLRELKTYDGYKEHIDVFCEVIAQPEERLSEQENDLKKTWVEGQDFII